MIRPFLSLILVLCLPPQLMGQAVGLGRGRVLGKIESSDKQDWNGAEVFFFSRPHAGCFAVGEPDRVRALAGEKGRFQAKLLPGRVYDVWAILKRKEGRYYVTNIVRNIVAGKLVQLSTNKNEQMEVRLRLLGQKRWPKRGPFSIQVLARNKQAMSLELTLDENGEAVLPPMPGSTVRVLVSAANGQRLLNKTVSLRSSSRKGIPNQIKNYRVQYAKELKKREKDAKKKALEDAKAKALNDAKAKALEVAKQNALEAAIKSMEDAEGNGDTKPGKAKEDDKKDDAKKAGAENAGDAAQPEEVKEIVEEDDLTGEVEAVQGVMQVALQDVEDVEDGVDEGDEEGQGEKKKNAREKPVPIPRDPLPEYLEGEIPGSEVQLLILPRAFKARFLVQDEAEQPLAGIAVSHELGDARLGVLPVLGKTDEKGRVDLIVPQPFSGYGIPRAKPNLNFLFSGADWGRAQDGWSSYRRGQNEPLSNKEVVARESEIRKVNLSSGFSIKGQVYWRKDQPAKNYPLVVGMPALVSYGPGSWGTTSRRSFIIYTDDKGEFTVPGWHQNLYGGHVALWVDGKELVQRFSLDMDVPDSLIRPFPILNLWGQSGDMELGAIYLSEMRIAQVEVRTAKGEQASFAEVAASLSQSMNWNSFDNDPANFRVADRRGRALILVPDSQRNLFVRLKGQGYFFGGMQIPEGKISVPLKAFPQLRPFSKVMGRVVDEKGKPVPGANLSIRSSTMMGGGAEVNMIYSLNWRLLSGKSDKQGYFALEFIPHPSIQFGVGVRARIAGKSYSSPDMIQVGTQPLSGLQIELPVNIAVATKDAKERASKDAENAVKDAGKAVQDAVGGVGAGIGSVFKGFLEQAKALADKNKAAKDKVEKKKAGAKKAGKNKTGTTETGKTEAKAGVQKAVEVKRK